MRFLRRLLWIVVAVIVAVPVLAGGALLILNDDQYRWVTIKALEAITGRAVAIEGPFELDLSLEPSISAQMVRVVDTEAPGSPELATIGLIEFTVDLRRTLSGTPFIKRMVLKDSTLRVVAATGDGGETVLPLRQVSIPIVEMALVENVTIAALAPSGDSERALADIESLRVDEVSEGGPVFVDGAIVMRGSRLSVQGVLGGPARAFAADTPYPIDLSFVTPEFEAALDGTVADVLRGEGLDLTADIEVADLTGLAHVLGVTPPPLDTLSAHARVEGTLSTPVVSSFEAEARRGDGTVITAAGRIADLFTLEELDIEFSGQLAEPGAAAQLLSLDVSRLIDLSFAGRLASAGGLAEVTDLEVAAVMDGGIEIGVTGELAAPGLSRLDEPNSLDLSLAFSSPSTAVVGPLLDTDLPELGAMDGKARLAGSAEAASLEDFELTLGIGGPVRIEMSGRVDNVQAEDPDADLTIRVTATDTAELSKLFGTDIPGIGPASMSWKIAQKDGVLAFEDIVAELGMAETFHVVARGRIGAFDPDEEPFARDLDLRLEVVVDDLEMLGGLLGRDVPDLGSLAGGLTVSGNSESVALSAIDMAADLDEGVTLRAEGSVGRLEIGRGPAFGEVELELELEGTNVKTLAAIIGRDIPLSGPVRAKTTLSDADGSLGAETFELRLGDETTSAFKISGRIDNLLNRSEIDAEADFVVELEVVLAFLARPILPDLGTARGTVALSDADGSLGIEDLDLVVDGPSGTRLTASGRFDDIDARGEFELDFSFETESLAALAPADGGAAFPDKPFAFRGRFQGSADQAVFEGAGKFGDTEFVASVTGSLSGERPRLAGHIDTPRLSLADVGLGGKADEDETDVPRADGGLFSRDPLPFDALREIDLDLAISAEEVVGRRFTFTDMSARVDLTEGRLAVTPILLTHERGAVRADLIVDAREPEPSVALGAAADDLDLGALLRQMDKEAIVEGDLHLRIDLTGSGRTPKELASDLNGDVELALDHGTLNAGDLHRLSPDRLQWIFATARPQGETELTCAVVRFVVEDGVATTDGLVVATPRMTLGGAGRIDLGNEEIDIVFTGDNESRLAPAFSKPVRVHGPLASPTVTAGVAGQVGEAAVTSGVIAGGYLAAPFVFVPLGVAKAMAPLLRDRGEISPCLRESAIAAPVN